MEIKVTVQFERCFRIMKDISLISWRNSINLYITEKPIKFSKSLIYFYLVILNKKKRTNALFPDLCFPLVGRAPFDGTNYYIFVFDTVYSPKLCQRLLKGLFIRILQPKPRNSIFGIESGGVLSC